MGEIMQRNTLYIPKCIFYEVNKMKNIELLDCTLRDGGYVNDWNFGYSVITSTYKRLDAAGVEYIEVGFLDERREFDINRTITPNTEGFNHIFQGIKKGRAIPVAMIDFGTCGIENIQDCKDTFIDGIRVIFKKEKIDDALPFCRQIKEKGYKLFIQAISITSYSDKEMLDYLEKVNKIEPYAFSIVDTYGLLDDRKLKSYFYLIDNNLSKSIKIGYHAHNNFQLAFSNSMKFLSTETTRGIVVDSTVYGMGKSAGNTASELIALHMNDWYGTKYDIDQFLEILDTDLMPIYQKQFWGYKYNFYISAMQKCHPNYVQYLLDKKTLSVTSINEILSGIPEEKKLLYDSQYILEAYIRYQSHAIDDKEEIEKLSDILLNKTILLLGPGQSLEQERDTIKNFIIQSNPIVISVNFEPNIYECQFVFVSNAKRYSKLLDSDNMMSKAKLIITSNISTFDKKADYVVNFSNLIDANSMNSDNALLLALALFVRCKIKKVVLAGFDGFKSDDRDYFDTKYAFAGNSGYTISTNKITSSGIQNLSREIVIEFLTKSLYESSHED